MMSATLILAAVGAKAFYLLLVWLASAIAASELSKRKGYGEKVGLGSGLLLSLLGALIWAVIPPKANSPWKQRQARIASAREAAGKR
jgi:hypothetical protein